jgi:hypothetical protein
MLRDWKPNVTNGTTRNRRYIVTVWWQVYYKCNCIGILPIRGVPRGGVWGVQTPPKLFRSFDKAEPNSQFRGKYILRTKKNTGFTDLQIGRNPWLGGYRPHIPVLSALCQLSLLNPPPEKNFWVRHCSRYTKMITCSIPLTLEPPIIHSPSGVE